MQDVIKLTTRGRETSVWFKENVAIMTGADWLSGMRLTGLDV